jgi:hypothetical protein
MSQELHRAPLRDPSGAKTRGQQGPDLHTHVPAQQSSNPCVTDVSRTEEADPARARPLTCPSPPYLVPSVTTVRGRSRQENRPAEAQPPREHRPIARLAGRRSRTRQTEGIRLLNGPCSCLAKPVPIRGRAPGRAVDRACGAEGRQKQRAEVPLTAPRAACRRRGT